MSGEKSKGSLSHEIIVGLFVLAIFAGLMLFTVVLSGGAMFGGGKCEVDVEFDRVGGLRRHDTVLVRGVPVGEVKKLHLGEHGVLVTLELEQQIPLRESYTIRAESSSLLGGMHLVVEEGAGELIDQSGVLRGLPPENVMENINNLVSDIRTSLNEGGVLTNIEVAVSDISAITTRLREGEGTIGRLLSTNDTLIVDLEATVADLRKLGDRLVNGEGTLGKLFSTDTTLYDDLSATVASLKTIGARLENGEGSLGKLLSTDSSLYDDLADTMASLKTITARLEKGEGTLGRLLSADDKMYTDLADAIASFKSIAERIDKGEGLLGQLISDDGQIGLELNGLIKEGRDMIDDLRETSPISTFSSIFFGAL